DPDADRLAIIDEQGRYLGEEKTLALCVDHVLRSGRRGPIVTNCSTSRMSEDLAAQYDVPFFRSKVGEANVVDRMLAEQAVLGGEGNGGVIDPRVVLVRDSFAAMALVLDAMTARGLPVSALADELPQYAIHKTTIVVPQERVAAALDALQAGFADAASRLARETEVLKVAVAAKDVEAARRGARATGQACAACHDQYRLKD
ncbi:MAG TPA: cytochrome c, partial [Lacipirellulaceae bacterium]|nr:cytochrome c [Lacipirellulaceae bacterium]